MEDQQILLNTQSNAFTECKKNKNNNLMNNNNNNNNININTNNNINNNNIIILKNKNNNSSINMNNNNNKDADGSPIQLDEELLRKLQLANEKLLEDKKAPLLLFNKNNKHTRNNSLCSILSSSSSGSYGNNNIVYLNNNNKMNDDWLQDMQDLKITNLDQLYGNNNNEINIVSNNSISHTISSKKVSKSSDFTMSGWDFWVQLITEWESGNNNNNNNKNNKIKHGLNGFNNNSVNNKRLAKIRVKAGEIFKSHSFQIPDPLRGFVWQVLSGYKDQLVSNGKQLNDQQNNNNPQQHSNQQLQQQHQQKVTPNAENVDKYYNNIINDPNHHPLLSHLHSHLSHQSQSCNTSPISYNAVVVDISDDNDEGNNKKNNKNNDPFSLHRSVIESNHLTNCVENNNINTNNNKNNNNNKYLNKTHKKSFSSSHLSTQESFMNSESTFSPLSIDQQQKSLLSGQLSYAELLQLPSNYHKVIKRDISRTYPNHPFFKDEAKGQESLFNVAKAYSVYDRSLGYCQGISFIIGLLLMHMGEEEAFGVLVRLMYDFGMRSLFKPQMKEVGLRMFQLDKLIEDSLPEMHNHFTEMSIHPSVYSPQWFLTMFASVFDVCTAKRVLDMVLCYAWAPSGYTDLIFQLGLSLLSLNKEHILQLDMDPLVVYLQKDLPFSARHNTEDLFKAALTTKINHKRLKKFEKDYKEKLEKEKFEESELHRLRQENSLLKERVTKLEFETSSLASQLINKQVECARLCEKIDHMNLKQKKNDKKIFGIFGSEGDDSSTDKKNNNKNNKNDDDDDDDDGRRRIFLSRNDNGSITNKSNNSNNNNTSNNNNSYNNNNDNSNDNKRRGSDRSVNVVDNSEAKRRSSFNIFSTSSSNSGINNSNKNNNDDDDDDNNNNNNSNNNEANKNNSKGSDEEDGFKKKLKKILSFISDDEDIKKKYNGNDNNKKESNYDANNNNNINKSNKEILDETVKNRLNEEFLLAEIETLRQELVRCKVREAESNLSIKQLQLQIRGIQKVWKDMTFNNSLGYMFNNNPENNNYNNNSIKDSKNTQDNSDRKRCMVSPVKRLSLNNNTYCHYQPPMHQFVNNSYDNNNNNNNEGDNNKDKDPSFPSHSPRVHSKSEGTITFDKWNDHVCNPPPLSQKDQKKRPIAAVSANTCLLAPSNHVASL